ncbi:hypothetical protein HII31_11978 [Pseudocercospora fuligena]|uniref:NB-ARC domain-containing protein n=1 Tax=Pseudocercospora fuligena TaxID=685502 RepID=A0A8H6R8X2_9PEZI|nr:hypothetical protein HII31_11978 [Pseudocercospora fuligena]
MSESNFWRQTFTGNNISGNTRVHFGNVHGNVYHEYAALPPPQPQPSMVLGYPRDKNFIGREHILEKLEVELLSKQGHRRVALSGLGGIGKSQIAIEFCYRYHGQHNDHWVFWISASSRDRFLQGFAEMCTAVTGEEKFTGQPEILSTGKRLLNDSSKGHWLLVIDNADHHGILFNNDSQAAGSIPLAAYIPRAAHGRVLISSRNNTGMEFVGHPDLVVKVPPFTTTEGVQLLAHKLSSCAVFWPEAEELVENLDCIPLAIAQAGACINRNKFWTVRDYLEFFRSEANQTALLGEQEEWHEMSREHGLPNAVFTTWRISFEQISRSVPLAAELLSFMSVLDRECIPESVLFCHSSRAASDEQKKLWHKSALGTLAEYSLIATCHEDYGSFRWRIVKMLSPEVHTPGWSMHRLIQVCTRDWLRQQDDTLLFKQEERATMVLAAMFPRIEDSRADPNLAQDATTESLLPHLRVAAQYGTNRSLKNHTMHAQMRLFDCLGVQERNESNCDAVVPWLERAHHLSEEVFGRGHPDTFLRKRRLGNIYSLTRRHKKALELVKDVVKVYDVMHGSDSEASSVVRNELAQIEWALGVKIEESPLSRDEMRQLDAGDMNVPDSLLYRAETRAIACMTGAYKPAALAEADALLRKVAESFMAKCGYVHRANQTLCLMSLVYKRQVRISDLERLLEHALLPFFKSAYGLSHEKTIAIAADLVSTKFGLGDGDGAELVFEEIKAVVNSDPLRLGRFQEWIQEYEQELSGFAVMTRHLTVEQKKERAEQMRKLYADPEFRQLITQQLEPAGSEQTLLETLRRIRL